MSGNSVGTKGHLGQIKSNINLNIFNNERFNKNFHDGFRLHRAD